MMDIVRALIGTAPPGLEFMEYLFAFILVVFGLFVVGYIAHLPFEFISNRFHRK